MNKSDLQIHDPGLQPKDTKQSEDGIINQTHIRDTFINQTGIDSKRFGDIYGTLLAYPEGFPVTTTYFHSVQGTVSIKSQSNDNAVFKHPVHTEFYQINNFEFRFLEQLNFEYDEEKGHNKLSGSAVFYSGFNPHQGDLFTYEIGDGKLGVFRITTYTPLTHRQGSFIKAEFILEAYATTEWVQQMRKMITDVFWFDKQRFLAGTSILLTNTEYQVSTNLQTLYTELLNFYKNKFFTEGSFWRPDGVYDPYVVNFIHRFMDTFLLREKYPIQYFSEVETSYSHTIWSLLSDRVDNKMDVLPTYQIKIMRKSLFASNINTLVNRPYIFVDPHAYNEFFENVTKKEKINGNAYPIGFVDPQIIHALTENNGRDYVPPNEPDLRRFYLQKDPAPYIFSGDFYQSSIVPDKVERLIMRYINNRKDIDTKQLLSIASNYRVYTPEAQFYFIPMFCWLIVNTNKSTGLI